MQFNSVGYLIFLFAVVLIYWLLPERLRRGFILLASVFFYATWGLTFIAVPIAMSVVTYLSALGMSSNPPRAKAWMWFGIGIVVTVLASIKYRDFLIGSINAVIERLGAHPLTLATSVALPIGISFYAFEAIGYLADVRHGREKLKTFVDIWLFLMFWPNVMSGPIVRARELMPQLKFCVKFEPSFVFDGIDRLILGLVQKNVLANVLGIWVAKGYSAGTPPSTIDAWFLAVGFGVQIYFDFAGYSNMAIGAARLLGITLPENFRYPYHASSPADFWARWHMSLSRWIRDYLFFPLNAKWKGSHLRLYLSLLGVMTLVGLWHGAGWNFVLWGFMHGAYLVSYRVYESAKLRLTILSSRVVAAGWRVLTLIAITAAWVPFRSSTLPRAGVILSSMFVRFSLGTAYSFLFYLFAALGVILCVIEPYLVNVLTEFESTAGLKGPSIFRIIGRPLAYTCGLLLFMVFDENNSQFIYSQF